VKALTIARDCPHVKGACKAVLIALATFADWRTGQNAFPSQAALADAAGVCDRTVRRALVELEDRGLIGRTGGRRSRRGRAVIVWRLILDALKPDTLPGRPVKQTQKQGAGRGKERGEGDAWAILASQYGWDALLSWSQPAIERAIGRIIAS